MRLSALPFALALGLIAPSAWADVSHTVARGHTLDAIAHRYHVTVKSIVDANHLKDPRHLRVGQTLVIPGVTPPAPHPAAPTAAGHAHGTAAAIVPVAHPATPVTYAARPKTPGVIHIKRLATGEDASIRVSDRRGRLPPPTLHTMEHVMRYPSGLTRSIDPRLIALMGVVSNHFGSRTLEIVSGFRPYSPTQYTAHSNHNIGHAVDFRVLGVPNEAVRDFCRTLRNTGCGYYPNSVFVHLDTRVSSAYWVDFSKPGEPPRYNVANPDADEGTSDVGDEIHIANPTEPDHTAPTPTTAPTAPPGSDMTPTPDTSVSY